MTRRRLLPFGLRRLWVEEEPQGQPFLERAPTALRNMARTAASVKLPLGPSPLLRSLA